MPAPAIQSPMRYQIDRKIADGGAAEVFLGKDLKTGNKVVLKVLRPEMTSDAVVVGRFLDESRVCQRLDHPGVVRHIAADRFGDGRVYLVTEYLEGEDLATYLRLNGPLSADDLVKLAVPLCHALAYVHQNGVVHRDLKPDNVFLNGGLKTFHPMLLDFGLANFQGAKSVRTQTGVILATPEYTPPECIDGAKADARSDLYALGVLLFEALTGSPPFVASNYGELMLKHLNDPPPPLPASAASLEPIIHRLLAKKPAERYRDAEEVARAFENRDDPGDGTIVPLGKKPVVKKTLEARLEDATETFGQYKVSRLLGEGAMGRVYLARHATIGRQVALKMMRPEHARNPQLVDRFIQEARTVNEINHEHIVDIFDFCRDVGPDGEPRVYCVMELLTGMSLSDLMRYEALPLKRIVSITRQMCSALAAAHKVGVVHRDVKPDNVFITERSGIADYVKVLDFGVAKLITPLGDARGVGTVEGAIIGTPAYMAPEQASGAKTDYRADIYAVGVVLFELCSGKLPFEGENFGKLLVEIMTRQPPPLGERALSGEVMPAQLVALIKRCLEKDPDKRFPTMGALESELANIAAAFSDVNARVAAPPGPVTSLQRPQKATELDVAATPAKSRRGVFIIGGVVIAAACAFGVVAGLGGALSSRPEPEPQPIAEPLKVDSAPAPKVHLTVESTPAHARVFRTDTGALLGETPLNVDLDKDDKPLPLRLELDGYESRELSARRVNDTSLSTTLEKKAAPPAQQPETPKVEPAKKTYRPNNKTKVNDNDTLDLE